MNIQVRNEYLGVLKELDLMETDDLLLVSIKSQEMYHQKEGKSVKTYVVSTSLNPPSCPENSFGTPWGLHEVNEIIGQDQPKGMVFQG
ncbi:MAG TPA: L,D-transpeptidase, partial [Opitutae bacterium]|nr:L,D-transpeptidase [Opitutae bacterium]